ncbi:hypothetical protein GCM10010103_69660 [Streptomyces paradoxus]
MTARAAGGAAARGWVTGRSLRVQVTAAVTRAATPAYSGMSGLFHVGQAPYQQTGGEQGERGQEQLVREDQAVLRLESHLTM